MKKIGSETPAERHAHAARSKNDAPSQRGDDTGRDAEDSQMHGRADGQRRGRPAPIDESGQTGPLFRNE